MSKEMIAVPAGNLLRVAQRKSITTLIALKEKTGVDRKTLRAINAGQPVKRTTLQSIATKLHVPLAHLRADKNEAGGSIDNYQSREIKLKKLDGTDLRKLAGVSNEITWSLNFDQMPDELEATLLKLKKSLNEWFMHLVIGPEATDNLAEEISYIKTSADIDKSVEELAQYKLKIFGEPYLFWEKSWADQDGHRLPVLEFHSSSRIALKIVPENKTSATFHVEIGCEPPQKFIETELIGIERVDINGTQVWSRKTVSDAVAK